MSSRCPGHSVCSVAQGGEGSRPSRCAHTDIETGEETMHRRDGRWGLVAALGLIACGTAVRPPIQPPPPDCQEEDGCGAAVPDAVKSFNQGLQAFVVNDRRQNWSEASCNAVASQFLAASAAQEKQKGRGLPNAHYNAGLAFQRCDKDADARKQFQRAAKLDPEFQRPKAQLALYDFQRSGDLDRTIKRLERIIRDAEFQNQEALVGLAALQMDRGSTKTTADGANDLERARRNLQRALALDDGFMPAFNQLAVYYLEQAKARAAGRQPGQSRRRRGLITASVTAHSANAQQLDLAALVASQGIRKNAKYAPLHNTAGLIQVELKDFNGAVKSFAAARKLDSRFFAAHMNYAAVNLSFRGFREAAKAYRDAIRLEPKDYEARLGLALALRGQIRSGDPDKFVPRVQAALNEAKKLEPSRPETYYNEAILTQEFRAKGSEKSAVPALERAAELYQRFIAKAGNTPRYREAVVRAKERSQDIRDTLAFIQAGRKRKAPAGASPPRT